MMSIRQLITGLAFSAVIAIAACSAPYANPNAGQPVAAGEIRLGWDDVDPRSAAADANAALARGEHHLLGIYDYAMTIPGITKETDHDILVIEDTGDYLRDRAHSDFNDRAAAYALTYNQTILSAIPEKR
jgi:hypothetical protein